MIGRLTELSVFALLAASVGTAQPKGASAGSDPRFRDYPIDQVLRGHPAPLVLATPEQRRYRSRINDGVLKGEGVWNGSWRNPIKTSGFNFAGHYFAIRWGCGSNCLMMAIVDGQTGRVYGPPLSGTGTEFYVSMDPMSDVEIDFEPQSSLMILRNGCEEARSECGIYYFNWRNNKFSLLTRTLVDLTRDDHGRKR